MRLTRVFLFLFLIITIHGCGFHLQGEMQLAPPLHHMYLQMSDPYGYFSRILQQYLRMSNVVLTASPAEAQTILSILQDNTSQELLSTNSTQQTRQYKLKLTVCFEITDCSGRVIVEPQTLTESRIITVQSDQILGSSNEATLYYQQMHRSIAYAMMNRIASQEITMKINCAFASPKPA